MALASTAYSNEFRIQVYATWVYTDWLLQTAWLVVKTPRQSQEQGGKSGSTALSQNWLDCLSSTARHWCITHTGLLPSQRCKNLTTSTDYFKHASKDSNNIILCRILDNPDTRTVEHTAICPSYNSEIAKCLIIGQQRLVLLWSTHLKVGCFCYLCCREVQNCHTWSNSE